MLPFQTIINKAFMSDNTVLSDQEKANKWWNEVPEKNKDHLAYFLFSRPSSSLNPDEIFHLWHGLIRKETSPTTTDDATYCKEIEKIFSFDYDKPLSLTDTILNNPRQEEEDFNDFLEAAYPSTDHTVKEGDGEPKEFWGNVYEHGLYDALEAIVKDWVGEEPYKDIPEFCQTTGTKTGSLGYWSPSGKMVKGALIDSAIKALQKARPEFKP